MFNFRCNSCDAVLKGIEAQIVKANSHKEKKLKTKLQIETEVSAIIWIMENLYVTSLIVFIWFSRVHVF